MGIDRGKQTVLIVEFLLQVRSPLKSSLAADENADSRKCPTTRVTGLPPERSAPVLTANRGRCSPGNGKSFFSQLNKQLKTLQNNNSRKKKLNRRIELKTLQLIKYKTYNRIDMTL